MKILITGTHGVGKSTLLNELKKLSELRDYKFIGGVTREVQKRGFKINEEGDWKTQLYCASIDIQNLLENENQNVVYDRSILDTYVYTEYLYTREYSSKFDMVRKTLENLDYLLRNQFDFIIWLRPEFKIEDDGVRSQDREFQSRVDLFFSSEIHVDNKRVFQLTGTIEERVEQFKKILYEKSIRSENIS